MDDMHSGVIHTGLRYVVGLYGLCPNAKVGIWRRDRFKNDTFVDATKTIRQARDQSIVQRVFNLQPKPRPLAVICEEAIELVREYDATIETFAEDD